ncbi:MAG TPA: hypothetical protein ENN28_03640 [Candidatus Uhrbacteria bacterium]|nr:hypothetical protein [Candidatus Uhrbacteria bacterium]
MYQTTSDKVIAFIWAFVTKYLVWLVSIAVLVLWYFYPGFFEQLGQFLLFWLPAIILLSAFIFALLNHKFRFDRDREQGLEQYDITVTSFEFYLVDTIVYLGTISILALGYILREKGVDAVDLINALIFFLLSNCLKQIFYKKILR